METVCTFEGGEADGQVLRLRRAPVLLRVVRAGDNFDALDQILDTPKPGETVLVYCARSGRSGVVHVDGHDKAGRRTSDTYATMTYHPWLHTTPAQELLRDRRAWQTWCDGVAWLALEEFRKP